MITRTDARVEFLGDLFITSIEHYGYGQFEVIGWPVGDDARNWSVDVVFYDDELTVWTITIDTIAKGLGVIRDAVIGVDADGDTVRINAVTGERLFFNGSPRDNLLLADRTNGDDGDYDVIGALAVLECALFGKVVYG